MLALRTGITCPHTHLDGILAWVGQTLKVQGYDLRPDKKLFLLNLGWHNVNKEKHQILSCLVCKKIK